MNEKLSYEEWRARQTVNMSPQIREDLKNLHNIDADEEVERAMRTEYEYYLGMDK